MSTVLPGRFSPVLRQNPRQYVSIDCGFSSVRQKSAPVKLSDRKHARFSAIFGEEDAGILTDFKDDEPKSAKRSPFAACSSSRRQVTIKDGDYTLREGVDYKVHYYRALDCDYPGSVCWVVVLEGLGKYNRTLFYGAEMGFPVEEEALNDQAEMEAFREHIRFTIKNGGSF